MRLTFQSFNTLENRLIDTSNDAAAFETQHRKAVSEQLEKVLATKEFAHAERLARFLRYVVERSLEQTPIPPKEYEVALAVFDRGDSFDSRLDSIVRVQAGRLRSKLNGYYLNGGREDAVVIEIPRGGYSASIRTRRAASEQHITRGVQHITRGVQQKTASPPRKRWLLSAACLTVLVLLLTWAWR